MFETRVLLVQKREQARHGTTLSGMANRLGGRVQQKNIFFYLQAPKVGLNRCWISDLIERLDRVVSRE